MKDISNTLTYRGKDYELVFNVNVLEAIQDEYITLTQWIEQGYGRKTGEPSAKALTFMLTEMINEGIEIKNEDATPEEQTPLLTRKKVGRMLTELGLNNIVEIIDDTMGKSLQGGEDSKNELSTKTKKTSR